MNSKFFSHYIMAWTILSIEFPCMAGIPKHLKINSTVLSAHKKFETRWAYREERLRKHRLYLEQATRQLKRLYGSTDLNLYQKWRDEVRNLEEIVREDREEPFCGRIFKRVNLCASALENDYFKKRKWRFDIKKFTGTCSTGNVIVLHKNWTLDFTVRQEMLACPVIGADHSQVYISSADITTYKSEEPEMFFLYLDYDQGKYAKESRAFLARYLKMRNDVGKSFMNSFGYFKNRNKY